VVFLERYNYVAVTNDGAAIISVTTNGIAATATGNNVVTIPAGVTMVIANQVPMWFPSSRNIVAGVEKIPTGGGSGSEVNTSTTVTTTPMQPGRIYPMMGSLAGGVANPGTSVSIIGTAANAYTVTAVG
jgi:hypothetical protein